MGGTFGLLAFLQGFLKVRYAPATMTVCLMTLTHAPHRFLVMFLG
jgi:hypothetical protein